MRLDEVKKEWRRARRYRIVEGTKLYPVWRSEIGLTVEHLDIPDALNKLFAWWCAHDRAGASGMPRRRQRADKQLVGWFDEFGRLGVPVRSAPSFTPAYVEGPDWWDKTIYYVEDVEDVAYSVLSLQAFARRVAGRSEGTLDDAAISVVSEGADRVRRSPETLEWEAPSLWSLLCAAVLNYEDLGWGFGICAAPDCENPFVVTRSNRTMCSRRCSKRMWAQKQAEVDSVR